MQTGGKSYYYHYNPHGDVVAMTDDSGTVVVKYTYDAWGNAKKQVMSGQTDIKNPFTYAGYMQDDETGMYYLIARYYNPEQGVFISADPDPGDDDDPITQNGYTYADNNPVMHVDPDGHWVWLAINAGFAAYDGYKAYKAGKSKKQIAWAVASNFVKVKYIKGAGRVLKAVHGNSRASKRANHGYEIYKMVNGKKRVLKVGISGDKITRSGKSYRATRQANKWAKKYGGTYHTRIVKKNMTRSKALKWEQGHVNRVSRAGGNFSRKYHRSPMPW
jgi:RHS repeat-associated protein